MPCSNPDLLDSPGVIPQITSWVRQAALIALQHFNHVTAQSKPDQTWVTQADLEIEQFLRERLQAAFPTHEVRGEEESWRETSQNADNIWVIDPIDGTTAFVQGLPGWGISVGLLHRGQPCLGAFYMPLLDDLTYATAQGEVYYNKRRLCQSVRREWGVKDFLAINASAHYDFQIGMRCTRAMGSIGASFVYTARGAAVGAFIPRAHLWDLVAGAAILNGTGGKLCYLSGQTINYLDLLDGCLTPEPLLAGHPDLQADLRSTIRPR